MPRLRLGQILRKRRTTRKNMRNRKRENVGLGTGIGDQVEPMFSASSTRWDI